MNFTDFLETQLLSFGKLQITLGEVIVAVLILIGARIINWLVNRGILNRLFRRRNVDIGRQYTISQFLRYLIYIVAFFLMLEALGVRLSVLLAGSAALLVGIGLALQDSFKDLVSGLILLGEGTVEVGDVLVVDGIVGRVTRIGLRTSRLETRDETSLIIPNSRLVVNNVENWTHNSIPVRFRVSVGVAYGSDVELVKALLLKTAQNHPDVLDDPPAKVQFVDFGNSSLDFVLLFKSHRSFQIEFVKSDLRFAIADQFKQNGIKIPFPQRDVWIRREA